MATSKLAALGSALSFVVLTFGCSKAAASADVESIQTLVSRIPNSAMRERETERIHAAVENLAGLRSMQERDVIAGLVQARDLLREDGIEISAAPLVESVAQACNISGSDQFEVFLSVYVLERMKLSDSSALSAEDAHGYAIERVLAHAHQVRAGEPLIPGRPHAELARLHGITPEHLENMLFLVNSKLNERGIVQSMDDVAVALFDASRKHHGRIALDQLTLRYVQARFVSSHEVAREYLLAGVQMTPAVR